MGDPQQVARPANILLVKPGAIGDLLQLTPVLRALRAVFPVARLSVLVGSRETATLFAGNPCVHETIVFDWRGEHRSLGGIARLWRRLRHNRYDTVVNYQRSNVKAWLLCTAAFPCHLFVYRKARKRTVHAVVNHLEAVAPLGIDPLRVPHGLEFHPGPEAERFAADLFRTAGLDDMPVVAINPGATHAVNRWGEERFASLADRIVAEGRARVVIIGGAEDNPLAKRITSGSRSNPLSLAGKTGLAELGAVLERCAVLVTGDTGPMHVATAVGTRVVALFGAADPERTGPVGIGHRVLQASDVACVPCRSRKCTHSVYLECMERISVDAVHEAVREVLDAGKGAGPRG
jgi:lipopolysaccharide heptosyltransferase II